MRFLQIGLGSMGKRRIRCLKKLGFEDIIGFDLRQDRCEEIEKTFHIKTYTDFNSIDLNQINAFIISVSPDKHIDYMQVAVKKSIPSFIEASVLDDGLAEIDKLAREKSVLLAPSCTLRFHPAVKKIKEIVENKVYGKVTNFSFHSGQYLPDWHPWEKIEDFYVSQKETGGGREIVPFELTWLVDVFGDPKDIKGFYGRTLDMGVDIDDSYAMVLKFKDFIGTLLVDVVSRHATRKMIINFEQAQINWDWEDTFIRCYDANKQNWIKHEFSLGDAEVGYNKNISEDMYIEEVKKFVEACKGNSSFSNTISDDIKVLKLLYKVEN